MKRVVRENLNAKDCTIKEIIADQAVKKRSIHQLSFPESLQEKASGAGGPEGVCLLTSLLLVFVDWGQ